MNDQLRDYIERLIDSGVDSYELLKESDKRVLLGYVLSDAEEPLNFLVETEAHKLLIHNFTNLLCGNQYISVLDLYSDLVDDAMDYNEEKMKEAFDLVKEDALGAYPKFLHLCVAYEDRRCE